MASEGDGRKVLVTGATGFIGRNLCRRLVESEFEVHATSRRPHNGDSPEITWWPGELSDFAAAKKLFAEIKPEIVFHLSGQTGAGPARDLVLPTYHSLATSTINVLFLAAEHSCNRIILFGSCNEPPADEPNPVPGSPYAAAKWISSVYGRMFNQLYSTPVVNLRPFMAYGPGQANEKLIPYVSLCLLRGERPLLTSCRTRGDWIYIDDVIDACISAINTLGLEGRTFDLGTGQLVPQRTLVDMLVRISGSDLVPAFGAIPDRPREHEVFADTKPAAQSLAWKAKTSLQDGLFKTWDWYRRNSK